MTLTSVYDFLNDEIDNIGKNISKLEEEIKVKNISIEEAKVFLKELNGEDSDESEPVDSRWAALKELKKQLK